MYTGGYSQAVNDESQRGSQQAYVQQVAQALAHQQWIQQQRQIEQDQRDRTAAHMGGLMGMFGGGMMPGAPPPGMGPPGAPPLQPPMPGAGSAPMMMPGEHSAANMMQQMLMPPGGGGELEGMAGAPPDPSAIEGMMTAPGGPPPMMMPGENSAASMMQQALLPPGGGPEALAGPALPPSPAEVPNWQASAAAPPELGGQPPSPVAPGAPTAAPGGAPPGMVGPPKLPPQLLSFPNVIQQINKMGLPPAEASRLLFAVKPIIEAQQQDVIKSFQVENAAQAAAIKAYAAEKAAGAAVTSANARMTAATARAGVAGAVPFEELTPARQEAVKLYADMQIGGDNSWRVGLRSMGGANLILQVDDYVPQRAKDLNLDASDIGTNKAKRTAAASALNMLEKDIATIEPFAMMLNQNADILKGLATKVIKTNSALVNRPMNWLQQNIGDNPDYADFAAQLRLLQTEAAKVIGNPRLTGPLTDAARKEIEDVSSGTLPLGAITRVVDRFIDDSTRRVSLMHKQRDGLTDTIANMTPSRKREEAKAAGAPPKPAAQTVNGAASGAATAKPNPPERNAKGWVLQTDKNGAKAYVSPDGTQFEEVR